MQVQFLSFRCATQWNFYRNAKLALQLVATGEDEEIDPELSAGTPIATATVNTDHRLELDEIIVKDYFENEDMVVALIAAGVVEPDFTPVYVGHYGACCARCRLTERARKEAYGLA